MKKWHQIILQIILIHSSKAIIYTCNVRLNKPALTATRSLCLEKPAFTCSNLTIETIEQGVKYVQS